MKKYNKNLSFKEKRIADKVADEILTVYEDEEERKYFFLILFLLLCLIFLVSSLSFAIFDSYYNGSSNNVIDVDISVDDDDNGENDNSDEDNDEDDAEDNDSSGGNSSGNKPGGSSNNGSGGSNYLPDNSSVVFSFNEGSNYINMTNVLPTSDEVGMQLMGENEYFDFNISAKLKGRPKKSLIYEISVVPLPGNTIDDKDVRVYLTENANGVSVNDKKVNDYFDLPDSKFRNGAKVIYRKKVNSYHNANYNFRMWLSSNASVSKVSKKFACKIAVDAYYK